MNYRWFISRTVRHATTMRKHVRHMLDAQRDILSPQAIENVAASLGELDKAIHSNIKKDELFKQMQKTDEVADKWLRKYPNANYRENVEVFLVALAVAMGIRTFFVQPFKIPTGSMQPTLYGVVSTPDMTHRRQFQPAYADEQAKKRDALVFPTGIERVKDWFAGISYLEVKAKVDGTLEKVSEPFGIRIINFWQTLTIGGKTHIIFFPPDYGQSTLQNRAGLDRGDVFKQGDTVVRMKIQAGDHLFVDRVTYNFRKPKRGEIAVFATAGIEEDRRSRWNMPGDQFYIKRMVAMRNERVQIGADQHLLIDGKRLDHTTPHFETVYATTQASTDPDNLYSGHAPMVLFAEGGEFTLRSNHFMVMGDNTGNSLDSRFFGDVDMDYIIGKEFFVYWPLTKRFGWGNK
jgi:signal peptidase I